MAKPVERPGGKKLTKFTHRLNKTVYLARAAVLRLGRGDPEADGIAAFGFKRSTAGAGRWRSYGRNPRFQNRFGGRTSKQAVTFVAVTPDPFARRRGFARGSVHRARPG